MKIANDLLMRLYKNGDLAKTGNVLDLGCGGGRDMLFLLENGNYNITGVEKNEESFSKTKETFKETGVDLINDDITNFNFVNNTLDLIIANNVLPFILDKDLVIRIIKNSINSLKTSGYLLFTLFGPSDEWAKSNKILPFTYEEAIKIINNENINIYFQSTEEGYGLTMKEEKKYWHIHRFILKKI